MTDSAAFARDLLQAHDLPSAPLTPAESWSNHVWIAPRHVVRLSSGRLQGAFEHECLVLSLLPDNVPHARVIAHGAVGEREWLILDRVGGQTVAQAWPHLSSSHRSEAIQQFGIILRALHSTRLPSGFRNPWLDGALSPGGPVRDAYHAPPSQYRVLLDAARQAPGVDQHVLDDVESLIAQNLEAFDDDPEVLVHGDLHFANILWSDSAITAILDFEGARPAATDLELDTILRFIRSPGLFGVGSSSQTPADGTLNEAPGWLAESYPTLFGHPRLRDRLAVYDALWQLVQLLHFPPGSKGPDPWGKLRLIVSQT